MFDSNHLSVWNGSNPLFGLQYVEQRFCDLEEKYYRGAASCDCHMHSVTWKRNITEGLHHVTVTCIL